MENMEFSLIIPVYNQGDVLKETIKKIVDTFGNSCEIIIINDASTDNTEKAIEHYREQIIYIKNSENMGKGYSVKKGILMAKSSYKIFTDADLPYGVEGIKKVFEKLKTECDIAVGHRVNPYCQNPVRLLGHKIFNLFIRTYLKIPLKDTQCGLKGFKADVADEIFKSLTIDGFAFDLEIFCLALKKGYKICKVDVRQLSAGLSTINMKALLKMLIDVRKIKKAYNS
ncbi:glycosyltransferase family 2 protein [Thermodesulfovibrio sp. TK110]